MNLILVISFALCHFAHAGPRLDAVDELHEAISNLQLLIPTLVQDGLFKQHAGLDYPVPKAHDSYPEQSGAHPAYMPGPLQPKAQKVYSLDGPFSDIPSGAFNLEPRKDFMFRGNEGRVSKKDLSRNTPEHIPENLVKSCLEYFQGRSQPKLDSLERIVHICTKLLDVDGIDNFIPNEKQQKVYNLSAEDGSAAQHADVYPRAPVECECCPRGPHPHATSEVDDNDKAIGTDSALDDIYQLFKPVGTPDKHGW